jgi:hypothetical protein
MTWFLSLSKVDPFVVNYHYYFSSIHSSHHVTRYSILGIASQSTSYIKLSAVSALILTRLTRLTL